MSSVENTWIIQRARNLGFPVCGITSVEPMSSAQLATWLDAGYGAGMEFLRRHMPLRADLSSVLPKAKSVICVAMPYPGPQSTEITSGTIASYARCADYHDVVRRNLEALWNDISMRHVGENARIFVDSGPLPERELARRAGIGWVGAHSCLIHPELGTRFVLGEILTTIEIQPSSPLQTNDACSACHACIHACPTNAIVAPGVIDARRCLSYLTIEHKGPIPREIRPLLGGRLFGCDTCQNVCPHNRGAGRVLSELQPSADLLNPDCKHILTITAEQFKVRFTGTPIQRAKRRGLLRNACIVLGNQRDETAIVPLRSAVHDNEPLIRGHAAWALGELGDQSYLRKILQDEDDEWVRDEVQSAIKTDGP